MVADVANHLGISPEYLSSLCRKTMKMTTVDYTLDRKIVEISTLLRFSCKPHFQNQFKKVCKVTSKQYRDTHSKDKTEASRYQNQGRVRRKTAHMGTLFSFSKRLGTLFLQDDAEFL